MTNKEKYKEELIEIMKNRKFEQFFDNYIKPSLSHKSFKDLRNYEISILTDLWFEQEYKEPEIDWSKVEIDTPIWVKNSDYDEWHRRHFAQYKDEKVWTYRLGGTSWTVDFEYIEDWKYAKLARNE